MATMALMQSLPTELAEALRHETAGEEVRWVGRNTFWRVLAQHLPESLFGAFFLGCAVCIELWLLIGVYHHSPETWTDVVGFPFVVLLLLLFAATGYIHLTNGPRQIWHARHTVYAITKSRFVSVTVGRKIRVESIRPSQFERINVLKRRRDGSGALQLILDDRKDIYIDLNNVPDVRIGGGPSQRGGDFAPRVGSEVEEATRSAVGGRWVPPRWRIRAGLTAARDGAETWQTWPSCEPVRRRSAANGNGCTTR
jgi:hypothetical protein